MGIIVLIELSDGRTLSRIGTPQSVNEELDNLVSMGFTGTLEVLGPTNCLN